MGTNPRRTEAPALRFSHASHLKLACLLGVLYSLSVIQAQDVHSRCGNLTPSPTLTPFVQPLPIPVEIDISTGSQLTLGAYKISQSVHPDLPNTTFYGYGTSQDTATSPGPTLNARRNVASFIRFENHITDAEHILTVDKTLHRATPANGGVPMSVHLHGADAEGKFDGHPEAWFTARPSSPRTTRTRTSSRRAFSGTTTTLWATLGSTWYPGWPGCTSSAGDPASPVLCPKDGTRSRWSSRTSSSTPTGPSTSRTSGRRCRPRTRSGARIISATRFW
ncbi:hypothetical protein MPTK2_8g90160P [Marchantia polymorpha subsp. ruderalis]